MIMERRPLVFCVYSITLVATILSLGGSTHRNGFRVVNTVVVDDEGNCPAGFTEIGGGCYFHSLFKLNWFRAMEFCHSFGSHVSLACIETRRENERIKEWLNEFGDHSTGVWVGGSDNGHVGRWAWFPTGQLIRNFNWGPAQPSGGPQHCMYVVGGILGYQWADFQCDFEMNFLCEYQVNRQVAWKKKRRRKKSMRFGGDFGLGGEGHSNSTREDDDDDDECAGQQRQKLDSDPWESREDEEEFGAL